MNNIHYLDGPPGSSKTTQLDAIAAQRSNQGFVVAKFEGGNATLRGIQLTIITEDVDVVLIDETPAGLAIDKLARQFPQVMFYVVRMTATRAGTMQ